MDVTVFGETTFTHPVKRGRNVFAYVIGGEAYFDPNRDTYGHEVVGINCFDIKRNYLCGNEAIILYGDGDEVSITAVKKGGSLSPYFWQAD